MQRGPPTLVIDAVINRIRPGNRTDDRGAPLPGSVAGTVTATVQHYAVGVRTWLGELVPPAIDLPLATTRSLRARQTEHGADIRRYWRCPGSGGKDSCRTPPLRRSIVEASPRPIMIIAGGSQPAEIAAHAFQSASPDNVQNWIARNWAHDRLRRPSRRVGDASL